MDRHAALREILKELRERGVDIGASPDSASRRIYQKLKARGSFGKISTSAAGFLSEQARQNKKTSALLEKIGLTLPPNDVEKT